MTDYFQQKTSAEKKSLAKIGGKSELYFHPIFRLIFIKAHEHDMQHFGHVCPRINLLIQKVPDREQFQPLVVKACAGIQTCLPWDILKLSIMSTSPCCQRLNTMFS